MGTMLLSLWLPGVIVGTAAGLLSRNARTGIIMSICIVLIVALFVLLVGAAMAYWRTKV